MIIQFTDNDYAVIVDSLSFNRRYISEQGHDTPNLNETIAKMSKWADPSGCQFLVVTGDDANLIAAVTEPEPTPPTFEIKGHYRNGEWQEPTTK